MKLRDRVIGVLRISTESQKTITVNSYSAADAVAVTGDCQQGLPAAALHSGRGQTEPVAAAQPFDAPRMITRSACQGRL